MNNAKAREVGRKVRVARAFSRALEIAPTIKDLQENGVTTLRGIAAALNERGIPTSRGKGQWQASQVRRLTARLKSIGGCDSGERWARLWKQTIGADHKHQPAVGSRL